jgi:ankyrin repeat protein
MIRPLISAIESDNLFLLKCLVFCGADIHYDFDGRSSFLHMAVEYNHYDIVEYLLDCGLNINYIAPGHGTPLMVAINFGFQRITDLLLRTGADITIQTKDGHTALKNAIQHRDLKRADWREYTELIKYFLDYKVPVNVMDPEGSNELFYVDDVEIATLLLEVGVDPNVQTKLGTTPLSFAVRHGNIPLIKLLLKYGADPNTKLYDGDSILHLANANMEIINILLEAGIDINTQNDKGYTYLFSLVELRSFNYHVPLITKLLKLCNLNIKDHKGRTVLYHAVRCGNLKSVELLLQHNAYQIPDVDGKAPLHIAIQSRDYNMCELLLKHGAVFSGDMIQDLNAKFVELFRLYEDPIKVACDD